MRESAAITLAGVVREYSTPAGRVRAVDGIDLDVPAGTSVAIVGPSGCGKSTVLGLIAGLETPDAGIVRVGDVELSALAERERAGLRRRELGLVFQADNLLPFLTALENVALQVALGGASSRYERCLDLLAELGISAHAHKLPDQLSGGQRQRVAVAAALVNTPRVVLADEPTGSLDRDSSAGVIDLLVTAQQQTGATLVVVTHNAAVAERMDATVRLADGRLIDAQDPTTPVAAGNAGA